MATRKYDKTRLDLHYKKSNETLEFYISDTDTSDFYVRLTRANMPIKVDDLIIVLCVIDPSNQVRTQFISADSNKEGFVYCKLENSMKSQVGTYQAKVMLVYENEKIVTDTFTYTVKNDMFVALSQEIIADERFETLNDMLSEISRIKNQEEDRVVAEKGRVATMTRIENEIAQLILDVNSKVNTNVSENTTKTDELILSVNTKVDDSLNLNVSNVNELITKGDNILSGIELNSNQLISSIDEYKNNAVENIETYKVNKDGEINQALIGYKASTTESVNSFIEGEALKLRNDLTVDCNAYKESLNTEFNKLDSDLKLNVNNFVADKSTYIDTYLQGKSLELTRYINDKNAELNTYVNTKTTELNNYISTKNTELNTYKTTKNAEIDKYFSDKNTEFNNNEKTRTYNESRRETNEYSRGMNENNRKAAEDKRVSSFTQMTNEFNTMVQYNNQEMENKYDDIVSDGTTITMMANGVIKKSITLSNSGSGGEGHTHANKSTLDKITEEKLTSWDNKVNSVVGKGLSTNDYTTIEKTKLQGIEDNANNYDDTEVRTQLNTISNKVGDESVGLIKDVNDLKNSSNSIEVIEFDGKQPEILDEYKLEGKTWNALGDSITAGITSNTQYVEIISTNNNMSTSKNYGMGGSMVSYYDGINSFIDRYKNMTNNVDLITVMGGTNDCFAGVVIGELLDTSTNTFCGALNTLIDGLIGKYPNGRIVFITPLKFKSTSTTDNERIISYVNAIKQVCDNKNIECIDMNTELTLLDDDYADGTHPNDSGQQKMADFISLKLKKSTTNKVTLVNKGENVYPITFTSTIYDDKGNILNDVINNILTRLSALENGISVSYGDIILSKSSTTIIEGDSDVFTVKLDKKPTNNQIVNISSNNSYISMIPTSLTFTPQNYSIEQTVTITTAEDDNSINDIGLITLSSLNVENKTIQVNVSDNNFNGGTQPEEGLVAYYLASQHGTDDTIFKDLSGNNNNATITGTNTSWGSDGLIFNGGTGKLITPMKPMGTNKNFKLEFFLNSMTIENWVKNVICTCLEETTYIYGINIEKQNNTDTLLRFGVSSVGYEWDIATISTNIKILIERNGNTVTIKCNDVVVKTGTCGTNTSDKQLVFGIGKFSLKYLKYYEYV